MTRLEQSKRDHRIAVDAAIGVTHRTLASRYEISERTVRRAIRRVQREDPELEERRSDYLRLVDAGIAELAAERLTARAPRTRIAAMGRQLELIKERERLLLGTRVGSASAKRELQRRFATSLLLSAKVEGLDEDVVNWIEETSEKLLVSGT